ncbi:unnamed protein product [Urochloa humidicola]
MRPPPHLTAHSAAAAAAPSAAAAHAGPSRRRPRHRGGMTTASAVACCRAAALASILAAGAATALLTFSLPASPISAPATTTRADFAGELSVTDQQPMTMNLSAPPARATPPPPPPSPSAVRRRKREPSYWRMAPEEALRYAKREIRDAEPVIDDPDLYAPLFKNVSQFKSKCDHHPGAMN